METTDMPPGATVLITGATGFIGRDVVWRLIERGDRPLVLTRNPALAQRLFGARVRIVGDLDRIASDESIDGVVNLAGAPVLGLPWTAARRHVLLDSRVGVTAKIAALVGRLAVAPRVLVSGSAIGYYGARGDEELVETDGPQDIFMSRLCEAWEQAAEAIGGEGVRVCRLRIGLVFGTDGGPLPQLVRPARLGLGAVLGDGKQWLSWIHKSDMVRMILFALDNGTLHGAVNAVAPDPLTNRDLTRLLCDTLHRPQFLRVPAFLLRGVLGEQADLLLAGQKVTPARALAAGFIFAHQTCEGALADLLGGQPDATSPCV